jgi:hypothetical protein
MSHREALTKAQQGALYVGLLAVQTAAATFMFWVVFPLFQQLIVQLGEPQELTLPTEVKIISGTLVLQCAYWARYRWIAIWVPFYSALIGHLIQFAGRVSFFFGGALFSVIFFRHLPELDAFPTIGEVASRGFVIFWVLFALFCYSLELDRFGRAMEEVPKPSS